MRTNIAPWYDSAAGEGGSSSALEASGVICTGKGVVCSVSCLNTGASTLYLQLFDATAVPADGVNPMTTPIPIPAGQYVQIDFLYGLKFTNGLCWAGSSTVATKTVGSAVLWTRIHYVQS